MIESMRFARWITKTKNTNSEYVILIAFPLQQWFRERASTIRYTYIATPRSFIYAPKSYFRKFKQHVKKESSHTAQDKSNNRV
jgi:hypothetical protein